MPPKLCLKLAIVALCTTLATALRAEEINSAEAPQSAVSWHTRLGIGFSPVVRRSDRLPKVHPGFGLSLSGLYQLPFRLSAGANVDWERYTFDSANHGDLGTGAPPRYVDQPLMHTRLMALLQWDILARGFITPFVVAGAGYGFEHAELTDWQCEPKLAQGFAFGGGLGVDMAVYEAVNVGIEYRANTLPFNTRRCGFAQIDDEPLGTPSEFVPLRIGVTVSLRK